MATAIVFLSSTKWQHPGPLQGGATVHRRRELAPRGGNPLLRIFTVRILRSSSRFFQASRQFFWDIFQGNWTIISFKIDNVAISIGIPPDSVKIAWDFTASESTNRR